MPRGGKRRGSGRPSYSSEFIDWVSTSIRNEIANALPAWIKARASRPKAIASLLQRLETATDELQAGTELEIAQAWKDGLSGQELLDRLSGERAIKTTGVYMSIQNAPAPTPAEMRSVYEKVAIQGAKMWIDCSPKIIKRVWLSNEKRRKDLEGILKKERSEEPSIV